ncbi:MAG: hypothetical protein KKB30_05255 [Proteobacteria bacterium]|nr:hypothetical protein [Pseudomonadota bacterium]MBU1714625.1 hypothetical protein [Pseudomonadota bacterium]
MQSVDARQNKIDQAQAWKMLSSAAKVIAARGQKVQEWQPASGTKEAILAAVIGPSGNLRAPTLRIGDVFLVGFNADLYNGFSFK